MLLEIAKEFERISSPAAYAEALQQILGSEHPIDQTKEHFFTIGLNTKNRICFIDLISLGTLDASLVHPRETFRRAVCHGVANIALAHNHPSGDLEPSQQDLDVTIRLIDAGAILGIHVLDHLIFATQPKGFVSLREDKSQMWNRPMPTREAISELARIPEPRKGQRPKSVRQLELF